MLDTSRHYYPKKTILHLLDGMMYDKFNVMHWHIVDQDFFPLEIPNIPGLSGSGSWLNNTYSPDDVAEIITYAMKRGVRVIP